MDGPHRESHRCVTSVPGRRSRVAIVGATPLSGTLAHAEIPVMTGVYTGANSNGSPMQLGVYDPDTTPV